MTEQLSPREITELQQLARRLSPALGPILVVVAEDEKLLPESVDYHRSLGFRQILVVGHNLPDINDVYKYRTARPMQGRNAAASILNAASKVLEGRWLAWIFNAEFLFFPFCATRSVADLVSFLAEERRESATALAVDLYAANLELFPDGVDPVNPQLDSAGYFALARHRDGKPAPREWDVYGGLSWRFEEHLPVEHRRIDRVPLFVAERGRRIGPDLLLDEPELNTSNCAWHHNPTLAIASFRIAKALRHNPASRDAVTSFAWERSIPFQWSDRQLLDAGLMEAGQWF